MAATRQPLIEQRSIDHVPETERHGRPSSLLTLWFASNVQVNALVTGTLAVFVGLDLVWAIVSILVGNLVGGLFMAYHSVQGPRLGVPQMIQSRAQFGFAGAILPMAVTVLMYLGFAVEGGVVAGQAIAGRTGLPSSVGVIIFNLVLLVIALIGHDLIHDVGRVISVVSAILFAALFVSLLTDAGSIPTGGGARWQDVLLAISIFVAWQITWAPYVSDYSRYLPVDTPARTTFWYTYAGAALGASWVMVIGALAALLGGDAVSNGAVSYLADRLHPVGGLAFAALLLSIVPAGAEGPYGAFLTAAAGLSARGRARSTLFVRSAFVLGFTIVATLLAVLAGSDLQTTFENITLLLLYLLVPWTAINLTDYYLVRKGRYDIDELFAVRGVYGLVNWRMVLLYAVTVGIEVPFVNNSIYEGPIAHALGGADLAWIIGLALPAAVVWGLSLTRRPARGDRAGSRDP